VLVHAHDGKDCDLLYKFRLITDQCDAPLVVVHSDKELVQCYSDRVAQARKDFMMPLDDHCTNIHHEVMLHDKDQKGQELVPILRSALQQTSAMVKERYAHLSQSSSMLQHANDTQSLRHLLYRGKRSIHDVHTEFLRRMQDMPHDEIAVSFLHSASMEHSRKQKTQKKHRPQSKASSLQLDVAGQSSLFEQSGEEAKPPGPDDEFNDEFAEPVTQTQTSGASTPDAQPQSVGGGGNPNGGGSTNAQPLTGGSTGTTQVTGSHATQQHNQIRNTGNAAFDSK
jgi:hypothetical protein